MRRIMTMTDEIAELDTQPGVAHRQGQFACLPQSPVSA